MAFVTALLAGGFSLIGSYVIAKVQARQAINAKDLEYRTKYSEAIQAYYTRWRSAQDHGRDDGYVSMVSPDERLMVIMVGKLFGELVTYLRARLAGH